MGQKAFGLCFVFLSCLRAVNASEWQHESGGNWGDSTMWEGGVPQNGGDIAAFPVLNPAGAASVSLDAAIHLGAIHMASPHEIQITGNKSIAFVAGSIPISGIVQGPDAGGLIIQPAIDIQEALFLVTTRNATAGIELLGNLSSLQGEIIKSGPGYLDLSGDNTHWQGALRILDGTVFASSSTALGTATTGTSIESATLHIRSASAEPLTADQSVIVLDDPQVPYAGSLTVRDSILRVGNSGGFGAEYHWDGPIILQDGKRLSLASGEVIHFYLGGTVTGHGILEIDSPERLARVTIEGQLNHSGDVYFRDGDISIRGENHYRGTTHITGGSVKAHDPDSLGDPREGTVVNGGGLLLEAGSAEPIRLTEGTVALRNSVHHPVTYSGRLQLGNGTLHTVPDLNDEPITISQPLELLGGASQVFDANEIDTILAGGITGLGDLELGGFGTFYVTGQVNHEGNVVISSGTSVFAGESLEDFRGALVVDGGLLRVDAPSTVASVEMSEGQIVIAEGASLQTSALRWNAGSIEGQLSGFGDLIKTGYGKGTLRSLGDGFQGQIQVVAGTVALSDDGATGGSNAAVAVTRHANAMLQISGDVAIANDIAIENAHGFGRRGALVVPLGTANLSGNLWLGDSGATVGFAGQNSTRLQVSGAIRGGDLAVLGGVGELNITSEQSDHHGILSVDASQLRLSEGGRLVSTEAVRVTDSTVTLSNSSAGNLSGRIADSIPVTLNSSRLILSGSDGVVVSESLAEVRLRQGDSEIRMQHETLSESIELQIGNLIREIGATVDFTSNREFGHPNVPNRVYWGNAPSLNDGMIGPWAFAERGFASYGPTGVVLLESQNIDIALAGPTTNYAQTAAVTLAQDTRINSLFTRTPRTLDLGGHTLTIDSGGVFRSNLGNGNEIINGTLTGGTESGGEFVIRSENRLIVRANIVDPPSEALSLIVTGPGIVDLHGTNTYTGKTLVNDASLIVRELAALPRDTEVAVFGGGLRLEPSSSGSFVAGPVTLGDNGGITGGNNANLQATRFDFESGLVGIALAGGGPIQKTTQGVLRLQSSLAAHTGGITIDEGIFHVEGNRLSTGTNQVRETGYLSLGNNVTGNVTLDGGTLSPSGRDVVLTGNVDVASDSQILLIDLMNDRYVASYNLTISGQLNVAANRRLQVNGASNPLIVTGPITLQTGAILSGNGTVTGTVVLGAGAKVEPGNSVGHLTLSTAHWSSGGRFVWEINDAQGAAGAPLGNGWDMLSTNLLLVNATESNPFIIELQSLDDAGLTGPLTNFNPHQSYAWPLVEAAAIVGFTPARVELDVTALLGQLPTARSDGFALSRTDNRLLLTYSPPFLAGDLNGDGSVTTEDIDRMFTRLGSLDLTYDFTGDGQVDQRDLADLVENMIGTHFGDANLDFVVDDVDRAIWQSHQFQSQTGWLTADFNGDGATDVRDWNLWLANRGARGMMAAVPEPASCIFASLLAASVLLLRKRNIGMQHARQFAALIVVLSACASSRSAFAQAWESGRGGNWLDPQNWSDNTIPDGPLADANFASLVPFGDQVVMLEDRVQLNSLTSSNVFSLTLSGVGPLQFSELTTSETTIRQTSGSGGQLVFDVPVLFDGVMHGIDVQDTVGVVRFDMPLQSTQSMIRKAGLGLLDFRGSTTEWSGTLQMHAGTARFSDSSNVALDLVGGQVLLEGNSSIFGGPIALRGGTLASRTGAHVSGLLTIDSAATEGIYVAAGRRLVFSGGTTGDGALVVEGLGTVASEGTPWQHTGGTIVRSGVLEIGMLSEHAGGMQILNGSVQLLPTGSLVGTGDIQVGSGGRISIARGAGTEPTLHSVSPQSVRLDGGTLVLQQNLDPSTLLHVGSSGGVLSINSTNFTAAGTNVIDFNQLPAGEHLSLSSDGAGSLATNVTLVPATSANVLRFGGGAGTLSLNNRLQDIGGSPLHVHHVGSGTTLLRGSNTYTGETIVEQGTLIADTNLALGASTTGTIVRGGVLQLNRASPEPLRAEGGQIIVRSTGAVSGPIHLAGGEVTIAISQASYPAPLQFSSGTLRLQPAVNNFSLLDTLALDSSQTSRIVAERDGTYAFSGGTSGTGNLAIESLPGVKTLNLAGEFGHQGDLTLAGGSNSATFNLNRDHSYSGTTWIDGGVVNLRHAAGLGTTTAGTVVRGGQLVAHVPTEEPLSIQQNGSIFLSAGADVRAEPVNMSGGTLRIAGTTTSNVSIVLDGGTNQLELFASEVLGSISGHGTVLLNGSDANFSGAGLSHVGDVIVQGGGVHFDGGNTFDGAMIIRGGDHTINHAGALGVSDRPLQLESGVVSLFEIFDRDLVISGGNAYVRNGENAYTGSVSLSTTTAGFSTPGLSVEGEMRGDIQVLGARRVVLGNGVFSGVISGPAPVHFFDTTLTSANTFTGAATISGQVTVDHPDALGAPQAGTEVEIGTLIVNVPITESIVIGNSGRVELNAPQPQLPVFKVDSTGRLDVNVPGTFDGDLVAIGGTTTFSVDATIRSLQMRGNNTAVRTADDATVHLNSGYVSAYGGLLDARLSGVNRLDKVSDGRMTIAQAGAESLPLHVHSGHVVLTPTDVPVGGPAIMISSEHNATLQVMTRSDLTYNQPIHLNAAKGRGYLGGLVAANSPVNDAFAAILRGGLDLGVGTAIISGEAISVQSPISGDGMFLRGGVNLEVLTNGHTYTGSTIISDGVLSLRGDGTLTQTSEIIVGGLGTLSIDIAAGSQGGDRLDASIPITMRGGDLWITNSSFDAATESLGELRLEAGSTIVEHGRSDRGAPHLTVASIQREAGTMLDIVLKHESARMDVQQPPPLHHGILGGWATIRRSGELRDFATIGPNGLEPFTDYVSGLAAAAFSDHVRLSQDATLGTDKQIQSLVMRQNANVLDLGGHALNIDSGGMLTFNRSKIRNGTITAGASGELLLYGGWVVEADITDNNNGPVDVTLTGGGVLAGKNSYTGTTYVNEGFAAINRSEALPTGTDLVIQHGTLDIRDVGMRLGEITVRENGTVAAISTTWEFERMNLESGIVRGVDLIGAGTIHKTGLGSATVEGAVTQFTGDVIVEDGNLNLTRIGASDVYLHGGVVYIGIHESRTRVVGRGGNLIFGPTPFTGSLSVEAPTGISHSSGTALAFEGFVDGSGTIGIEAGTVDWRPSGSAFTGELMADGGTLALSSSFDYGNGPLAAQSGGTLQIADTLIANPIRIENGELSALPSGVAAQFLGAVSFAGNSFLSTRDDAPGAVFSGEVSLVDGSYTTLLGAAPIAFTGDVRLFGSSTLAVTNGNFALSGTLVPQTPQATLNIVGGGLSNIDLSFDIPAGTTFELLESAGRTTIELSGADQALAGSGTIHNDVIVAHGAKLSPGPGAGNLEIVGSLTFAAGGQYDWELSPALNSTADPTWDFVKVQGDLFISASAEEPFVVDINWLTRDGVGAEVFDKGTPQQWSILSAASIAAFDPQSVVVDATAFMEALGLSPRAFLGLEQVNNALLMSYTPDRADIDENGVLDAQDIDGLLGLLESNRQLHDLNRDGSVDRRDIEYLVRNVLGTEFGDANLDGKVDDADLAVLQQNLFSTETTWASADFNGDHMTDAHDLNLWLTHRGFTAAMRAVPEPGTAVIYGVMALLLLSRRRQELLGQLERQATHDP